jgi:hypothetical protein
VAKPVVVTVLCILGALSGACENKGPAETAGAKVDQTLGKVKNAAEAAGDKLHDAADDANKDIKSAAHDVAEGAQKAADELKK